MEIPVEYSNGCNITKTSEIVICARCNGTGEVRIDTDDPGYEGPWWKHCHKCKGSGRLMKYVTTEFLPFSDVNTH